MKKFLAPLILAAGLLAAPCWAAVDVNTADAKTLASGLTGVGSALAAAIIAEREANGPFASLEDLDKRVKGIGKKTIEKNKDVISFGN